MTTTDIVFLICALMGIIFVGAIANTIDEEPFWAVISGAGAMGILVQIASYLHVGIFK